MVLNLVKQVFSVMISLLLVITIGGINIFVHHCQTENKSYIAIFHSISCEDHHAHASQCCKQIHDITCQTNNIESCTHSDTCKCCTDKRIFIHIDEPLLVSQQHTFSETEAPDITSNETFKISELFNIFHTPILHLLPKPPPKQGAFMVILFQTLKIPTFLS